MSKKQFLTPPEIAELLGVGHDKVLAFIRNGELKATDLSTARGRPRYASRLDWLNEFVEGNRCTVGHVPTKPNRQSKPTTRRFYK